VQALFFGVIAEELTGADRLSCCHNAGTLALLVVNKEKNLLAEFLAIVAEEFLVRYNTYHSFE